MQCKNYWNWFVADSLLSPNRLVLYIFLLFIYTVSLHSQDIEYARRVVKTFASSEFHGRGYVKKGDIRAAKYIRKQLKAFRIQPFKGNYFQKYGFNVNTFPGTLEVSIDGKKLAPGYDFMAFPSSGPIQGIFEITKLDTGSFVQNFTLSDIPELGLANKMVLLDTTGWGKDILKNTVLNLIMAVNNPLQIKGFALVQKKELFWWVLTYQSELGSLIIKKDALPENPQKIEININSNLKHHKTINVTGYIPGEIDSFIVFTAHFDHLGQMGKDIYFPGANDNASGTAMSLDFVREYTSKQIKPKYNMAFLFFSGEEVGLFGSRYYTEHPLFPLHKIKFLINLDMEGTGSGGVMVKSGRLYPKDFGKLDSLNKVLNLNLSLNPAGLSKGSDHYPFHQKGIKALYINTEDKNHPYHSPEDKFENLPFTVYEPLFKLIVAYINTF